MDRATTTAMTALGACVNDSLISNPLGTKVSWQFEKDLRDVTVPSLGSPIGASLGSSSRPLPIRLLCLISDRLLSTSHDDEYVRFIPACRRMRRHRFGQSSLEGFFILCSAALSVLTFLIPLRNGRTSALLYLYAHIEYVS